MASAKEKILNEVTAESVAESVEELKAEIKAEIEALKVKIEEVDKLANDLLNTIRMG